MIGFLSGEVVDRVQEKSEVKLTVLVGNRDQGGVGYLISVPIQAQYDSFRPGERCQLFIHSHIREDSFDLFGFASSNERQFFQLLLSVNGIGPRAAMAILSGVTIQTLVDWILAGERDLLTKIPGVGKKTAERLMLELADPIRKKVEAGTLEKRQPSSSSSEETSIDLKLQEMLEAKEALLALGYKESTIVATLRKVQQNYESKSTEEWIRFALKELN